ncbi:MAG: DUF1178 family protein [Micropepsaceae bacterium]
MIRYDLICRKEHRFEGWFASSAAYDAQADEGRIACPMCNSKKIAKAPMAPSVAKGRSSKASTKALTPAAMRAALVELRRHVETNAENVGSEFADEARAIHHGEAEDRPIYGDATAEEGEALAEEGISVARIPWVPVGDA